MAKRRRGVVERVAVVIILIGLGWLALHVAVAQLSKAETETFETGDEMLLYLDEGERRGVYLKQGATTGAGLGVSPRDLTCRMEPTDPGVAAQPVPERPERPDRTAMVDGWNVYDEVYVFTAPVGADYQLACTDDATELFFPNGATDQFGMSDGAVLHVTPPVEPAPSWVSPGKALVTTFIVVAFGGLLWVVGGFLNRQV